MASPKSDVMKVLGGDPCPECGEAVAAADRVKTRGGFRWDWHCQTCHMKELHEDSRREKLLGQRQRDWLRMVGINVTGED